MKQTWQFYCYCAQSGRCEVEDIYDSDAEIRAKFDTKLKFLRSAPLAQWRPPLTKKLTDGDCDGLVEIRFEVNNVQQRPLGFFHGSYVFVFLGWATERNGRLVPPNICATCQRRKTEVISDNQKCRPCKF